MIKLRGELPTHRCCSGPSPLSYALCDGGDPSAIVVQFRTSLFYLTATALHRLDGLEQIGAGTGSFYALVFVVVNATYISVIWEHIDRAPDREVSPTCARLCASDRSRLMPFGGCGCSAEISAGWARNLHLLPDRLSEARSAGSWEGNILG
jgi:hypothetical protein